MRAFRVTIVAALLAAACLGAALWWRGTPRPLSDGPSNEQLADLSIGGPYRLTGPTGQTITQDSFPGRWKLIYFGYTSCPDVCPTTLQAIAAALTQLGPSAARVVPLFITIDPARDTPAALARYTALFDKRIIGLSGSQAQITAAETAFRVYAARAEQPGSNSYLMDHTSFIYVLDPHETLRALFDRGATAATIAIRLQALLS